MKSDNTEQLLITPDSFSSKEEAKNFINNQEVEAFGIQDMAVKNSEILKEIDSFLYECEVDKRQKNVTDKSISEVPQSNQQSLSCSNNIYEKAQNALERHCELMEKMKETSSSAICLSPNFSQKELPLMSLNDLWSSRGTSKDINNLHEERFRREHCEKKIYSLQARILEYQQKIVVAMQVDRIKDDTILKLQEDLSRAEAHIDNEKVKLMEIHEELERRNALLERELTKSELMVKNLQDRNEIFQAKITHLTKANNDIKEITKKQIEDLKIRLSNSLKVEQLLNDDLVKVKMNLEEEKSKIQEFEKKIQVAEVKTKEILYENENVQKILKDFQTQQCYLKSYYESQLNNIVSEKIKEFEHKLNASEAENYNLESLCQKYKQEIDLLTEKHSDELSLSCLQHAVSTKIIEELQEKINLYETRRMNTAQRLHSVMEVQWQKILDILMNPTEESYIIEKLKKENGFKAYQDSIQSHREILLRKSLPRLTDKSKRENTFPEKRVSKGSLKQKNT